MLLNLTLIIVKDDTKKHIDQEEPTKQQVDDEEYRVRPTHIVSIKHHIWKVSRRNCEQEIIVAITECVESSIAFKGALVHVLSECCEVKNEHEYAYKDHDRVFEVNEDHLEV